MHVCLCVCQTLGQEKERLEAQVHQHPPGTHTNTHTHANTFEGPITSLRTSLEANKDGRGVGGGAHGVGREAGVRVGGGRDNSRLLDKQAAEVQRGYVKLRRLRQEFAETQRLLASQGSTDQPWTESVGLS